VEILKSQYIVSLQHNVLLRTLTCLSGMRVRERARERERKKKRERERKKEREREEVCVCVCVSTNELRTLTFENF